MKNIYLMISGIFAITLCHAQNIFPNTGSTGVGTTAPLTLFHIAVPDVKTSATINTGSLISTNETSNPFGLRTMLFGASDLSGRYAALQTTDWSLQDGGNLYLQPSAGNVAVGTTDAQGNRFLVNGTVRVIGDLQIDNPNRIYFTTDHTTYMQSVGSHQFRIGLSADPKTQIAMYPNQIEIGSDTQGQGFTVADGGYSAINWVPTTSNMLHIMGAGSQTHLLLSRQDNNDFFKCTDQWGTATFASIGNDGEGRFGLGTSVGSAVLQANSTTMGFLSPRMTNVQRDAINAPVEGLEIYSTTDHAKEVYTGSTWQMVGAGSSGNFNTGSIVFAGSTGNLTQDNQHLYWDGSNQRFGIGTATPVDVLTVKTGVINTGSYGGDYLRLKSWTGTPGGSSDPIFAGGAIRSSVANGVGVLTFNADAAVNVSATDNGTEVMRILGNGNVVIGATDPQGYKLAVNGNAVANSMTVRPYPWYDDVFRNSYRLMPLRNLENYVILNQHLPDIPSAAQVSKKGLDLGEINGLLVKKVEELTLYMIEKDKQVIDLQEKLQTQDTVLKDQQEQLKKMALQLEALTKKLGN
jgi:hypothetical protein